MEQGTGNVTHAEDSLSAIRTISVCWIVILLALVSFQLYVDFETFNHKPSILFYSGYFTATRLKGWRERRKFPRKTLLETTLRHPLKTFEIMNFSLYNKEIKYRKCEL